MKTLMKLHDENVKTRYKKLVVFSCIIFYNFRSFNGIFFNIDTDIDGHWVIDVRIWSCCVSAI